MIHTRRSTYSDDNSAEDDALIVAVERIDKARALLALLFFTTTLKSDHVHLLLLQILGAAFFCALSAVSIRRPVYVRDVKAYGGFVQHLIFSRKATLLALYLILWSYGWGRMRNMHSMSSGTDGLHVRSPQQNSARRLDVKFLSGLPQLFSSISLHKRKEELRHREIEAAVAKGIEEERIRVERMHRKKAEAKLAAQKLALKVAREKKVVEEQKIALAKERKIYEAKKLAKERVEDRTIEAKQRAEGQKRLASAARKVKEEKERQRREDERRQAALRKAEVEAEARERKLLEALKQAEVNLASEAAQQAQKEKRRRKAEKREALVRAAAFRSRRRISKQSFMCRPNAAAAEKEASRIRGDKDVPLFWQKIRKLFSLPRAKHWEQDTCKVQDRRITDALEEIWTSHQHKGLH